MSLREDVELYTKLSGEDGSQETIGTIGAYLRGYRQGKEDAEPHWIPVTERLPEEKDAGILKKLGTSKRSEYVLATVEVKGERMTVTACTYDGKWDWNMKYAFPDYKIVAWMPLPESYKGVTDGRD